MTTAYNANLLPYHKIAAISKSDSTDLTTYADAIWTGTGGTIVLTLAHNSSSITLTNVQAGQILPCKIKRVYETNTTANDLFALYIA